MLDEPPDAAHAAPKQPEKSMENRWKKEMANWLPTTPYEWFEMALFFAFVWYLFYGF